MEPIVSSILKQALTQSVPNARISLRELLDNNALSPYDRRVAEIVLRDYDKDMLCPVMKAYHHGRYNDCIERLKDIADPVVRFERAYRLAATACYNDDPDVLKMVHDRAGIDITKLYSGKAHVISYAVEHIECLRCFLNAGFDVSTIWLEHDRPTDVLIKACGSKRGSVTTVDLLMKHNAVPRQLECTNALVAAVERGNRGIAKLILMRHPDMRLLNNQMTPAMMTVVNDVLLSIIVDLQGELSNVTSKYETSVAEHEQFLTTEMPSMIASAVTMYGIDNIRLRKKLGLA